MKFPFPYTTIHSSLFYRQDDVDVCSHLAEITNIDWDNQTTIGRCQYCGHDYTGEECPGCAARRKEKIAITGVAVVVLRGYAHPDNAWMMSLPRHLELHYANCGRMDDYANWDWRIILEDCETIDKQVIDPNSLCYNEAVIFTVKLKANVLIQYVNPAWELKPV